MSNENSNLRVGSAGAGLFVGSTEILSGGGGKFIKGDYHCTGFCRLIRRGERQNIDSQFK